MSFDDYSKGYLRGQGSSSHAQQGWMDRQRDDERAQERSRRQQQESMERQQRHAAAMNGITQNYWARSPANDSQIGAATSAAPTTFAGAVKGFTIMGIILALLYGYFGQQQIVGAGPLALAVEGAVGGAACGVGAYIVIVLLRVAAVILRFALYAGLALFGIYLLGSFLR